MKDARSIPTVRLFCEWFRFAILRVVSVCEWSLRVVCEWFRFASGRCEWFASGLRVVTVCEWFASGYGLRVVCEWFRFASDRGSDRFSTCPFPLCRNGSRFPFSVSRFPYPGLGFELLPSRMPNKSWLPGLRRFGAIRFGLIWGWVDSLGRPCSEGAPRSVDPATVFFLEPF